MFCCLFKKVTVHNTAKLNKISCNKSSNFLGIGGSDGFVKVVQIDLAKKSSDGPNNPLTFTQNLICHKKNILMIEWNNTYDKLTTCDEEGVIIVWKFTEKGIWETEMINNREMSYVTDLKWSKQGLLLCFVYDDGHAIVGTVEGSRCWGNDIKDKLYLIEWSPDASYILFACHNFNIIVFSSSGYQVGEMEIENNLKTIKIVTLSWWTNSFSENQSSTLLKHLMIAFTNGVILLYDDYQDTKPLKIVTDFSQIIKSEWNPNGDLVAVLGYSMEGGERKDYLNIYSPDGELLKVLKVPNTILTSFTWDYIGTKLAITTEGLILFALVKQKFKWTYFSDTLVYSFMQESEHHSVIFWDTKKNTRTIKYVKNMLDIVSYHTFSMITAKVSEDNYILILGNSIGSPVDNRIINIHPVFMCMNKSHAFVTNRHYIYIWQFKTSHNEIKAHHYGQELSIDILKNKMMRETMFFIEDTTPSTNEMYNVETFQGNKNTADKITAIYANEFFFIVACESGKILRYSLPGITQPDFMSSGVKFNQVGISPDGNYLWGVDEGNLFTIYEIEKINPSSVSKKLKLVKLDFEKKDVWNVIWSIDESFKFALLEKNRLNIIKNLEVEEILGCSGYLAECSQLGITAIMLEDLVVKPSNSGLQVTDIVVKIETRILRDLREMMSNNIDINDIYLFIERNSNRRLWEMFSEYALLKLDFVFAEKSMLNYSDYLGLSFIKRVKQIDDDNLKRAEIYQFFLNYDKAEEIYILADRKDLIISMRIKLGHWERVTTLMKDSGYLQEDNIKMAYDNLATQLFEAKEYDKAEELFKSTNNYEALVNVYFKKEDFSKAADFINDIAEGSDFLLFLGEKFENYGLCDEAVTCYLRYGDVKKAIDTCILMNRWNLAVELAEKHNFFQIDALVNKFCNILIEKNKKMDLVELYRKSHKHTEAARMLIKIVEDLKALNTSPIILKKIYVVAALEMESFKSRLMDAQITQQITHQTIKTQTLDTLITSDLNNINDKSLNNPWKGAEAYHFYMLCQSQLYKGQTHSALKTALRLVQYEKELDAKEVYRLISFSAFLNQSYKECSKAMSKLENLPNLSKEDRDKYQELAISIFTHYDPQNIKEIFIKCPGKNCGTMISEFDIDCKNCGSNFSPCVLSGQSLFEKDYVKCKRCKHKCLKTEVSSRKAKFCALCHLALTLD